MTHKPKDRSQAQTTVKMTGKYQMQVFIEIGFNLLDLKFSDFKSDVFSPYLIKSSTFGPGGPWIPGPRSSHFSILNQSDFSQMLS